MVFKQKPALTTCGHAEIAWHSAKPIRRGRSSAAVRPFLAPLFLDCLFDEASVVDAGQDAAKAKQLFFSSLVLHTSLSLLLDLCHSSNAAYLKDKFMYGGSPPLAISSCPFERVH